MSHVAIRVWTCCALLLLTPTMLMAQTERPKLEEYQEKLPWDFKPYDVYIWVAGLDQEITLEKIREPLTAYLDRDFESLWKTKIEAAPISLSILAGRDFESLNHAVLTADDPVLVIKRDHPNAARIRFMSDIKTNIEKILVSADHIEGVKERGAAANNATLHDTAAKYEVIEGSLSAFAKKWNEPATEAMVLPRGIASVLEPKAKIMELDVSPRMGTLFEENDKIFLVHIDKEMGEYTIAVREIDCLMRHSGPVMRGTASNKQMLPSMLGHLITEAFGPLVRLDDVGTKEVTGTLRASGLILDENSPANIKTGEFLQPLVRKNDRNGEPSIVEAVQWSFLRTLEKNGGELKMELYSAFGSGALSGRKNSRTFRMAMKLRKTLPNTTLRLHLQGEPNTPLAGYDIFDRDLETKEFTEVGQTDWDGRLVIEPTATPMRWLYVKNGQLVLARLPIVPGLTEIEVADLPGDDIRLQAEAYIRGVQNAIIDLVAIRTLLASSIRRHLQNGDLPRAQELLQKLREEPSYENIANDMAQKQTIITSRNRSEQKKIDNMFAETRTLLVKHINPSLVRQLDAEVTAAGGGAPAPTTLPGTNEAPTNGGSGETPAGTAATTNAAANNSAAVPGGA